MRKDTPRSARAIAVTIASGTKPRRHLCPRYTPERELDHQGVSQGPRDPTAFIQQLADTASIRRLDVQSGLPSTVRASWHSRLDHLAERFASNSDALSYRPLDVNHASSHHLSACFKVLLRDLPRGNSMQWRHVNRIVSTGCVYPQYNRDVPCDPFFNTWLAILDGMEDYSSMHLLSTLLRVLDQRRIEEGRSIFESAKSLTSKVVANLLKGKTRLIELLDIIVWLKKVFLRHWDGEVRISEGSLALIALEMLDRIYRLALRSAMSIELIGEIFWLPVVAYRLDAVELARMWGDGRSDDVHILEYGFLFTVHQVAAYFRTMNHLTMRKANSDAEIASALHSKAGPPYLEPPVEDRLKYLEDHYLLLNVSRDNVLQDAFDQLWQRRSGELLRPLRVRLGEMDGFEVGHDLGGVQIEFFNLVCKEVLLESARMQFAPRYRPNNKLTSFRNIHNGCDDRLQLLLSGKFTTFVHVRALRIIVCSCHLQRHQSSH